MFILAYNLVKFKYIVYLYVIMSLFVEKLFLRNNVPLVGNVVDILTSDVPSYINHLTFDENLGTFRSTRFAVNYGLLKGNNIRFTREFIFSGFLYEIDRESRLLIVRESGGTLYYDEDKFCDLNCVGGLYKGSKEDFIGEFMSKGYLLK